MLALLIGVFAACGEDEGDRTLRIRYWQAPTLANPYLSSGDKDRDAGAITLEPLAHYGPDGELVPALAEEIPTIDNGGLAKDRRAITWRLKDGLKWSDGSELTSDDLVFTWRYCAEPETGCTALDAFGGIESVAALDSRTVRIEFDAPMPHPYVAFVGARSPVISRAQFAECVGAAAVTCEEQNRAPRGTGPYRIISFDVEQGIRWERNPHYRGPKPYFDHVVLLGGGDAASAANAVLAAGTADYAWNLQVEPDFLERLELFGNGKLLTGFSDLVERLILNQTNPDPSLGDNRSEYLGGGNAHPLLSFAPIRRAMSLAIDRGQIAELSGFAGRAECNLIAGPPRFTSGSNDDCRSQQIGQANRLLDEHHVLDSDGDGVREYSGVPLRFIFQTSTNEIRQATQALLRDWWREIGIETTLIHHDASLFFGGDPVVDQDASYRRLLADLQMYTEGSGVDPQRYLGNRQCSQIASRDNNWARPNIARFCDRGYDAAFEHLTRMRPGSERELAIKRLNDLLVQTYVEIPLVSRGMISAHANTLLGIRLNPWDSELWNIAEWHR